MLDDLNVIKQRDPQDYLNFVAKQPQQLAHDFGIAHTAHFGQIDNIVFAGMGGSALAAELARSWPELRLPFVVCKEYNLPAFVNERTLAIISSYSGNTEETLGNLEHARAKKAQIAIIAHGGKLLDAAREGVDVIAVVPECVQPRTSILYGFRALMEILVAAKLVPEKCLQDLLDLVESLTSLARAWTPDMPSGHNLAKELAHYMAGKTPIIYAGPLMYPAAYIWKITTNENAKNTAWCNFFPELNHNEFIGWSSHPVDKPFAVINLISQFEHPRILKRFEVTDRLLSGMRPKAITIQAQGKSTLEHLLYFVLLGGFATTYLALLNGVNPSPVDLVEKFKKELG